MTTITIRISKEEKEKLNQIAAEDDRTLSYVVRQIIKEYLADKQQQGDNVQMTKTNNDYKLVYRMNYAMELIKMGHNVFSTSPNPQRPQLTM